MVRNVCKATRVPGAGQGGDVRQGEPPGCSCVQAPGVVLAREARCSHGPLPLWKNFTRKTNGSVFWKFSGVFGYDSGIHVGRNTFTGRSFLYKHRPDLYCGDAVEGFLFLTQT